MQHSSLGIRSQDISGVSLLTSCKRVATPTSHAPSPDLHIAMRSPRTARATADSSSAGFFLLFFLHINLHSGVGRDLVSHPHPHPHPLHPWGAPLCMTSEPSDSCGRVEQGRIQPDKQACRKNNSTDQLRTELDGPKTQL